METTPVAPPQSVQSGWHVLVQCVLALLWGTSLVLIGSQVVRSGIASFGVAPPWDWPSVLAIEMGLIAGWGYVADHVYSGHHTTLTGEGARQRRLFGKDRYLPWAEVKTLSIGPHVVALNGIQTKILVNGNWFREPRQVFEYILSQLPNSGRDASPD